jgi:hypothetical protein
MMRNLSLFSRVGLAAAGLFALMLLGPGARADATGGLSGKYKGSITYLPQGGVTPYDDTGATMVIQPAANGKGPTAVVTYSYQLGRCRETCSITPHPDGTITLQGVSWKIISGSSFYPDTFTVRVAANGSVSGTSVDSSGGTSKLSMHH